MGNSENARLYYEAGQDLVDFSALTDKGDHKTFDSPATFWSLYEGKTPEVQPNGLINGGAITPAVSGTDNLVDVAELNCNLAGVETTVLNTLDVEVGRATSTDTHKITSITVTAAGAIAAVEGADGTSFSATRGADGGPPWIPSGSIEIGQVRTTSYTDDAISTDEIKSVPNTHVEYAKYPVWKVKTINVDNLVAGLAGIVFNAALPQIHSDDAGSTVTGKKVYVQYYEPQVAEIPDAENFVPPEQSYSVNSKQVYGRVIGSSSASLGQGSFTFYPGDGVTDNVLKEKGKTLLFKFYPDILKPAYEVCQGKFGIARSFPAGDSKSVACTISAETQSSGVAS